MATTNVSDQEQNYSEKVQDLYCQLHKATVIHNQLTFIAVLNAFLSITAFLGNVLVLVALRKESSLHPPSKLLFRSLAVTDLCVGYYFRACRCYFFGDSSESKSKYLSLRSSRTFSNRKNFGSSVFVDTDCNKRGQTSCPVVGAEIQTGDYFEANQFNHYHFLGAAYCLCHNKLLLEFSYSLKLQNYSCINLSRDIDLLLYKDFPYPPSSSKTSTRPCSTAQPNKSTEHSAILKSCINGTVVAVCVSHLLSTTRNIETLVH